MTLSQIRPQENWTAGNNGFPLMDDEVRRYLAVVPAQRQLRHAANPFYLFLHFGMNTATGREWGKGDETPADFTVPSVHPDQWARAAKAAGAAGMILTCKHHDGFCLWDTKLTDFSVMHSPLRQDVVRLTAHACAKSGLNFGVYLSPWDMHEPSYGKPGYNDYFCGQLEELLTGYGDIFEVWFDGAKGETAPDFTYDWDRYYQLVRRLQPGANIAVCGPDVRWVGNEAGKTRESEFSVVPLSLTRAETIQDRSQHSETQGEAMKQIRSGQEDLGSRQVLAKSAQLCWYPAEVDVSIRPGWFYHPEEDGSVKTPEELFNIYLSSVGSNCSLLLNVPPDPQGKIGPADTAALEELGKMIRELTARPLLEECPGQLGRGCLEWEFGRKIQLRSCLLEEDVTQSQRVEAFDLYLHVGGGAYIHAYSGTVVGVRKWIPLDSFPPACGALLAVRQSRGAPCLSRIGFYSKRT